MKAYSVADILKKKYRLFEFQGDWYQAFSKPERAGVWFVWGNSGNGKTTFVLALVKYLASFTRVVYNSLEEGTSHTIQQQFINQNFEAVARKIILVNESIQDLSTRLNGKRAPEVAVIDSFQYAQINYKEYIKLKEKHRNKLLIFVSHADGKQPAGRAAKSVMYDATLKIWVEGYKALSKGRYIGPTGEMIVWPEGAVRYWGDLYLGKEETNE